MSYFSGLRSYATSMSYRCCACSCVFETAGGELSLTIGRQAAAGFPAACASAKGSLKKVTHRLIQQTGGFRIPICGGFDPGSCNVRGRPPASPGEQRGLPPSLQYCGDGGRHFLSPPPSFSVHFHLINAVLRILNYSRRLRYSLICIHPQSLWIKC